MTRSNFHYHVSKRSYNRLSTDKHRHSSVVLVKPCRDIRARQIYASPTAETGSLKTDTPAYCTMFHHMVKSGGTSIRSQLSDASASAGGPDPGQRWDVSVACGQWTWGKEDHRLSWGEKVATYPVGILATTARRLVHLADITTGPASLEVGWTAYF